MNQEAQIVLKKILAKEPHELTENDIAFLKARLSYVGKSSREKFAAALSGKIVKPKAEKKVEQAEVVEIPVVEDEEDEGDDEIIDNPFENETVSQ